MKKSPLKRCKGLAKVSPKQAAMDAEWHVITRQKAQDLEYVCQWCGGICLYSYVGHHIIRRARGRIDTYENCFVCHRFPCHDGITRGNIDVREYPNREAWSRRSNG